MELHQLRYFLAVVKHLHFGKAAQAIPISPSTLSQQVQKLEEELRTKLFDRLPRSIRLTKAGEAFVGPAKKIVEEVAEAYAAMAPYASEGTMTIRLGVLAPVGNLRLYNTLKKFSLENPRLQFVISERWTSEMLNLLHEDRLDAAIFSTPDYEEDMEILPFFEESVHVIMPADHPLAKERVITLEQLCKESFILPSQEHLVHTLLLNACAQAGLSLNVQQIVTYVSTLFNSVADGCGISVAYPAVASPFMNAALTSRPLMPELRRKVAFMFPMTSQYRDIFSKLYAAMKTSFTAES